MENQIPNKAIIEHIESHLGKIECGFKDEETGIFVIRIQCHWDPNLKTHLTLGLSDHALSLPNQRKVRQEIFVCMPESLDDHQVSSELVNIAEYVLVEHRALLRGEVIKRDAAPTFASQMAALYVTTPFAFDDSFAVCDQTSPQTVFAMLLPIFASEANFISAHGWGAFETRMEENETNVFDINRSETL